MSLDNLVGKTLEKIEPDRSAIKKLLASAERNIADSHVMEISSENRFDASEKGKRAQKLNCHLHLIFK
jgi:hypothetical protein